MKSEIWNLKIWIQIFRFSNFWFLRSENLKQFIICVFHIFVWYAARLAISPCEQWYYSEVALLVAEVEHHSSSRGSSSNSGSGSGSGCGSRSSSSGSRSSSSSSNNISSSSSSNSNTHGLHDRAASHRRLPGIVDARRTAAL